MNTAINIHRSIVWVGNFIIVAYLTWITIKIDSDKAPALFIFFYGILLLLNLVVFIFLNIIRSPHANIYRAVLAALIILPLPLAVLITSW